jgi:hypothetical protein
LDTLGEIRISPRRPFYRLIEIPEDANPGDTIILRISGANNPGGLFQLAIDVGQVAKFGGESIYFSRLRDGEVALTILMLEHPELAPGSILYLTLYDAVASRTITASWSLLRAASPTLAGTATIPATPPSTDLPDPTALPATPLQTETMSSVIEMPAFVVGPKKRYVLVALFIGTIVYFALCAAAAVCLRIWRARNEREWNSSSDEQGHDTRLLDDPHVAAY